MELALCALGNIAMTSARGVIGCDLSLRTVTFAAVQTLGGSRRMASLRLPSDDRLVTSGDSQRCGLLLLQGGAAAAPSMF